ncbi:hypothetical protein FVE67_01690 [Thermosulfurimonas marina]|uniref:DUF2148 domain-containing protein n=1 Tax=Thermosulfurimonas marina TaxID=2047767 RepID=A0A6H1WQZ9_9BACT|nr:DUF2148 domain-containing protein [Thermosulfurimonas marina]QJA05584.1 hypothetical protein FVE67_01690 [Thermosulfurimonas marina]
MQLNPEKEVAELAGRLMLTAARTAPKARGQDEILTALVTEPEEKEALAREMEKIAERGKAFAFFKRDAENVRQAEAVVLIGLKFERPVGVNCRACGLDCERILKAEKVSGDYEGPLCALRLVDLGIAVGSAVSVAKDLCVDNRVMYTIGVAARRLGWLAAQVILGVPLSIKGKNIFFDRKA